MPIKLILILILVVLVAVLTGFNLSNVCTIWFFHTFTNIPVFAALLVSFILGVLVTLPFTIGKGKKLDKSSESEISAKLKNSKFNKNKKNKTSVQTANSSSQNATKFSEQNQNNQTNVENSESSSNQNSNSETELDVSDENYVPPKSN